MTAPLDRRAFVRTGALAGAALVAPPLTAGAAAVHGARGARPVVVASANGHASRGPDGRTCIETAFDAIARGGDVLDALVDGVEIVERDPTDTSVGYGGLPNADGVVQLDASVMHGPRRRAGGVACLEGVRTPARVAKAVLEHTDHHLLVGRDAQRFARQLGFAIEDDLNTDASRALWLEWKRRTDPSRWPDPERRLEIGYRAGLEMVRDGLIDREHYWGTIHCSAVSADGAVCGVTTTSGLAWKVPGRVGDSPILGAGLYVDTEVGAAGSTGRGEANLYGLCSFLIVENLRRGMAPADAGLDACRRIVRNTVEPRLLDARGRPAFGITFYILTALGGHAGVAMYPGTRYAVCDEGGPRLIDCVALYERQNDD